jgi:serine/threonine-protein kinase
LEIWTVPLEGERDRGTLGFRLGKAEPFLRAAFDQSWPAFSPDRRWLAYQSNETGTYEVYVRPFPGPGGKWPISTSGGQYPIWSRNGHELFFISPDQRIMIVDYVTDRDVFAAGKPRAWIEKGLETASGTSYDLSPDGTRFAVVLYAGGRLSKTKSPSTESRSC